MNAPEINFGKILFKAHLEFNSTLESIFSISTFIKGLFSSLVLFDVFG